MQQLTRFMPFVVWYYFLKKVNLKHCYIHWCYFLKLNFYSFLGKGVHGPHVEVRGQLIDNHSLLPLCGLQRWNSNQQVWQQVLLPCKSSSHWLGGLFLLENYDLSSSWLPVANTYHSMLTLDAGNRHHSSSTPSILLKEEGYWSKWHFVCPQHQGVMLKAVWVVWSAGSGGPLCSLRVSMVSQELFSPLCG